MSAVQMNHDGLRVWAEFLISFFSFFIVFSGTKKINAVFVSFHLLFTIP